MWLAGQPMTTTANPPAAFPADRDRNGRHARIPAGRVVAWVLATMPRDRWRGIVGVTDGSSPGPSTQRRT